MIRPTPLALALPVLLGAAASARAEGSDRDLFYKQVWPLLQRACLACHGEDDPENGFRVDSREALIQGGKTGPAVKPGAPDESLFMQVVRWNHSELLMPPGKKLPEREISLLATWISRGAPWPPPDPVAARRAEPEAGPRWRPTWWAGPPRPQPVPTLGPLAGRARGEIDRFVLGQLETLGIAPVAAADRRAWLRRATYTLTGALPTPAEMAAFLADRDDGRAREQAVDRLLASPAHGRHWARLWSRDVLPEAAVEPLDRALAAAAAAYEGFVAGAASRDLPFDAFLRAHLPGVPGGADGAARSFLALAGAWPGQDQGPAEAQVAAVGRAFLALNVDCARCHDHPSEPLRASDYAALAALVNAEAPAPAPAPHPWLALAESPLLARVVVNRVWRAHIGQGLVATADEFGAAGEPPSHRALLDHLAARFVESGGSLRWLHREIVLSATFGLAVARGADQEKRDPDNVFLWRAHPRVADERAVREAALALAAEAGPAAARAPGRPAERLWRRALGAAKGRPDLPAAIEELYRLVLGRAPTEPERAAAESFVKARPRRGPALAEALLASEEFRLLL